MDSTSSKTISADNAPTSFGVFKPVGHVMIGLPSQRHADALVTELGQGGWDAAAVQHFQPRESVAELEALVENAGSFSGFGYEITLLRRYLELAKQGTVWLLVKVDGTDQAGSAAEVARRSGATLAVHYRSLTIEELI